MARWSSLPNLGRRARWGTLGLGPLARNLVLLALPRFLLIFHFPLVMGLISLTMIFSSAVFANKKHIAPKLSLVDVAGLNKVLRSEMFVNEDRQLRAVHLILNFEPLSNQFQDVGQVIRVGDLRQFSGSRRPSSSRTSSPPCSSRSSNPKERDCFIPPIPRG